MKILDQIRLELEIDRNRANKTRKPRKREIGKRDERRAEAIVQLRTHLDRASTENLRTNAWRLARHLALGFLPRKPTADRDVSRVLRLGTSPELWVKVTYSSTEDEELAHGQDRYLLAAIVENAIANGSPVVTFRHLGDVLRLFGLPTGGSSIEILRQRFRRLQALTIRIAFASSREALKDPGVGENLLVIRGYSLPTRRELRENRNSSSLAPTDEHPYSVRLSDDFFNHLRDPSNHLLVPFQILYLFRDSPTGWDYACLVIARCLAARSPNTIDHETLLEILSDSDKEPDRVFFDRLGKYHAKLMAATGGQLKARLEKTSPLPTGGRPKDQWVLRIERSSVVTSGRQKKLK